ncbi:hypothetical protein AVEN_54392-1 [Araneus ventricosus]|uniref:Uncharacterized protein n=1 Tax=Araneus ventricosus TaxID=182803 RepID=A0A4Y2FVZ8_ARAVE|nr:hypothetical protein AVEN_54392-1 [Araneus ventricosus]
MGVGVGYLGFGEHEVGGHFESLGPGQVLVHAELVLELQELLAREGRPRSAGLAEHVRLTLPWKKEIVCLELVSWLLVHTQNTILNS